MNYRAILAFHTAVKWNTTIFCATAIGFVAPAGYGQQAREILKLEKEIPLSGVEGRIDHFSADAPGKQIFIAALGNGTVEVVGIGQGRRTSEIKGTQRATRIVLRRCN